MRIEMSHSPMMEEREEEECPQTWTGMSVLAGIGKGEMQGQGQAEC